MSKVDHPSSSVDAASEEILSLNRASLRRYIDRLQEDFKPLSLVRINRLAGFFRGRLNHLLYSPECIYIYPQEFRALHSVYHILAKEAQTKQEREMERRRIAKALQTRKSRRKKTGSCSSKRNRRTKKRTTNVPENRGRRSNGELLDKRNFCQFIEWLKREHSTTQAVIEDLAGMSRGRISALKSPYSGSRYITVEDIRALCRARIALERKGVV